MTVSIRRLGAGDEGVLEQLARDDDDFDLAERGAPRAPLTHEAARAYLGDPSVLHWAAEWQGEVVGHLQCSVLRKRAGDPEEVLLYEVGVRSAHRRQGVGRALLETLQTWMLERHICEAWVLGDNPGAVEFYRACGFGIPAPPPTYMTRVAARRS